MFHVQSTDKRLSLPHDLRRYDSLGKLQRRSPRARNSVWVVVLRPDLDEGSVVDRVEDSVEVPVGV